MKTKSPAKKTTRSSSAPATSKGGPKVDAQAPAFTLTSDLVV